MNETQILILAVIVLFFIFKAKGNHSKKRNSLHALSEKGACKKIEDFLKSNVNIDEQDERGMTPLHIAVLYEHILCVELLLSYGANMHIADNHGDTPLHTAVDINVEIVKILLANHAKMNVKNNYGRTALATAVSTPNNLEVVKLLVENGADIDQRNNNDENLIHEITCNEGTLETLKFLVEEGIDINYISSEGYTPLDLAIGWKNEEARTYLSSLEAKTNKAFSPT